MAEEKKNNQSKSEYVENTVRAMREMYQAEGQEFDEAAARANAEKQWDSENAKPIREEVDNSKVVEHIESLRNGGNENADAPKELKKDRLRSALSSVLNGQAFKDRIGR